MKKKHLKQCFCALLILFSLHVKAQFTSASFQTKQDFSTGANSYPENSTAADLDNDGKMDIITSNSGNNKLAVFRNVSTGTINSSSLNTALTFSTGSYPFGVASADIDGDGKQDLVSGNYSGNSISVLRNITSGSSINFNTKIDYATGGRTSNVVLFDVDGDGKKDIVSACLNTDYISVFKNNSTSGTISFGTRLDFSVPTTTTGNKGRDIIISDLDNDNVMEIIVLFENGWVRVFKNYSTSSSISLTNTFNLAISGSTFSGGLAVADLDSDNKPDFVVTSFTSSNILVFKNSTVSGSISFASSVSFSTGTNPSRVRTIDLDGDNKQEILVVNRGANNISVFKNTSTTNAISSSSFATKVDYSSGDYPMDITLEDINDDGKKDLIVTNSYAATGAGSISILKNNVKTLIMVNSDMLYPLYTYVTEPGTDPIKLFDEPLAATPSTYISPVGSWSYYEDISLVVDLGNTYTLTDCNFYDGSGDGDILIYTGDPSSWTYQTTLPTNLYNAWNNNTISFTTRFIRLQFKKSNLSGRGWPNTSQINFYGIQTTNIVNSVPAITSVPLPNVDDLMGVNAAVWNSANDLIGIKNARVFMAADWMDRNTVVSSMWPLSIASSTAYPNNKFRFDDSYNLGSNLDNGISSKVDSGISIFPCIQQSSMWLYQYGSPEQRPVFGTGSSESPSSYIPHAELLYHTAGRYGNNTSLTLSTLSAKLDVGQTPKVALNKINYIENWNEPNKWFADPMQTTFFSPFELAAMSSVDYDADQNRITGNISVNKADPNMKMVMGGLANLDLKYIKSMRLWSDYNRTTAGKGIFPADVLNFHHYPNPNISQLSTAYSPEDDNLRQKLMEIVEYRNRYMPTKELWLSEIGYGDGTITNPLLPNQNVPAITGQTKSETQANWLLRTFLAVSASGFDKAMWFSLDDDVAAKQFANCGLREQMRDMSVYGTETYSLKPAWYYYQCMSKVLKGFKFASDLSASSGNSNIMIYKYTQAGSSDVIYAVWYKTSNNSSSNYTFPIATPSGYKALTITPNIGNGKVECLSSSGNVFVSEKPIFIKFSSYGTSISGGVTISSTSTANDLINRKENVNRDIIITGSSTQMNITNSSLIFGSCAQIKVTNGAKLTITESELLGCGQWLGIFVDNSSELVINKTSIKNALVAVMGDNPLSINITKSDFDNNWLSVGITNNNPANHKKNITIDEVSFSNQAYDIKDCAGGDEDPRSLFASTIPSLNNYINFTNCLHSPIYTDKNTYKIDSHTSIVVIKNCYFNGIEDVGASGGSIPSELTAILINNSRSIEIVKNSFNAFNNEKNRMYRGIDAIGPEGGSFELIVDENVLNRIENSIRITKYNNFWVKKNNINYGGIGVEVYNDDYSFLSYPNIESVVCLIANNIFNTLNKGVIIAPKLNPFLATSNFSNNSLTNPSPQSVGILCNSFVNVTYGISGVDEIINQLDITPTKTSFAENQFIVTTSASSAPEWDIVWIKNGGSPWNYNINAASATTFEPNSPTRALLFNPLNLNGLLVDISTINNFMVNFYTTVTTSYCFHDPLNAQNYVWFLNQVPKVKQANDSLKTAQNNIYVYPNPVADILMIKGIASDSHFEIYDIAGKRITQGEFNVSMGYINVESLLKGLYIIKLNYKNEVVTRKFLK